MLSLLTVTPPVPAGEYINWEDAFSAAELEKIEMLGDGLMQRQAAQSARYATNAAWIERNSEMSWLHARLEQLVMQLNTQYFGYALHGLAERFLYTVHQSGESGHSGWNKDHGYGGEGPRKISLSLQLSQSAAYEGGELEFHVGGGVQAAPRKRGTLIAYPSYLLHRTTPIRSGIRKSLLVWATGPEFR
jgi:PKHD-type hydroxylase